MLYRAFKKMDTESGIPERTGQVRQLAAVMFADMTGYTAMMQEDEQKARVLRDRQRSALEQYIPAYSGKIIQYFGDGTLSIFSSASDAVRSAIAIQKELQQDPKVNLRIGIHSGDIVYDNEGLYGDCVNLASRIESLAVPGAVFISDKVFDEVKNQSDIHTRPMGRFNLKNIKKAVEVFAVANEGLVVPTAAQVGAKTGTEKSIAVLPFVNMSTDPENEYFSDGMAEEILTALTRVKGLRVTARSSSFSFKGKNEDIRTIGSTLGVTSILSGSVRKSGKRMRITAQLINTDDGYHVWSETFDSDVEDIFEVQDDISKKILARLKEDFSPGEEKESVVKVPTQNMEAYNYYLKGKYYWSKSTPDDIKRAITNYEQAIAADPAFALPYCALSSCYSFLGSAGLMHYSIAYPRARDLTLKAIELDPNLAEAHLSLASIKFYQNWDFDGAEASLQKAVSLNLNSSLINQVHGWFLIAKGDFEQAIIQMEEAVLRDPLSLPIHSNLADAYSFAGRFQDAIAEYEKVIELDANYRRAYEGLGMIYMAMQQPEKAIEYLEKYHKMVGHELKGLSSLGHAYAMAGNHVKAEECLAKIKRREIEEPDVLLHMDFAFIYSGMKEFDKAFEYLYKTYENRMGIACLGMIFCIRYPMLNDLKTDKRFTDLITKMGLVK